MKWIIYYGNDFSVTDQDATPFRVPGRNVQVIAQEDPDTGQTFVRSNDYYWWTDQGWQGGDIFGLFDYLADPGYKRVLFGRTIGNREFEQVLQKALNNTYLPKKSAWRPNERRSA